jgi:hypothetical protein
MPTYDRDGPDDNVQVRVHRPQAGASPVGDRAAAPAPAATAAPAPGVMAPISETVLTDADGRRLTLREPDILQESRLVRALGDAAMNAAYMAVYVLPASMVASINDEPLHYPQNQLQAEAAIKIVGRKGLAAITKHLEERAAREKAEAAVKN